MSTIVRCTHKSLKAGRGNKWPKNQRKCHKDGAILIGTWWMSKSLPLKISKCIPGQGNGFCDVHRAVWHDTILEHEAHWQGLNPVTLPSSARNKSPYILKGGNSDTKC